MPWPKGQLHRRRVVACADCGREVVTFGYGTVHLCPACKDVRRKASARKYQQAHPLAAEVQRKRAARTIAGAITAGRVISISERVSITWPATVDPDLLWTVRVGVPFHYGMSKNRMLGWTKKQKPHLTKEFRDTRGDLRDQLALAFLQPNAPKVVNAKLWIDIYVQKPDNRGDAVNVVDLVCDAIKEAIGLDDRWYSIRRLDWQIVKEGGHLFVGMGQETRDEHQACSSCGRVLLLDAFTKGNRQNGRSGNCRECLREGRKLGKAVSE